MTQMQPNRSIRCHVSNCAYHCGEDACCSLQAIQVEPCGARAVQSKADESMCGSFRHV